MGDSSGVKTSALAIVPETSAWPAIQALRLAHDKQVHIWPPHVNILYPFVSEREFEVAGQSLATALSSLGPLKLRFSRKGHFGATAFLRPECDEDPNLVKLYDICKATFPDLSKTHESFQPHLTIGQFKGEAECRAFLESCPYLEIETEISCLCLLARDSMQHPFRTPLRVRLGVDVDVALEEGGAQAYSVHRDGATKEKTSNAQGKLPSNYYQLDDDYVRLVFTTTHEAAKKDFSLGGSREARSTLFVVDQSGSMGSAYNQVKASVRYMLEQCSASDHEIGFVLYNHAARLASAEEVLNTNVGGTTSFAAAFEMTTKYIESLSMGREVTIVFMTDGQDTASTKLAKSKTEFESFLKTCGRPTTIHAIGFTSGHDRQFLEELCSMGSFEGMYRYAEIGSGLEQRFAEMFDFAEVNLKAQLLFCGQELFIDAQDCCDGVSFDIVLPRAQFASSDFAAETFVCAVTLASGTEVQLKSQEIDSIFTIRCVDEMAINTQQDLQRAQDILSQVQVHKANKSQREQVYDARCEAQARLDKYHQLFAAGARKDLIAAGGNLAAELSSLRHEATFSKARRARTMAQRATANASMAQIMEKLLHTLPAPTSAELEALESKELTCTLSGDTPQDALRDSRRDFFVFSLRVRRPEDVIDAPTVLDVMQFLSGAYSNEAFRMGAEYALQNLGGELAHGGFAGSTKHPIALGEEVGLFRGPDGQLMNACLPLYLSEAHFARVKVQIKPILGYFFTLDPLGYKGDQIIALFQILGLMLCARHGSGPAGESGFSGIWADWLVNDFTQLCRGLKPLAMEYLAEGGYTGMQRGDLLDDFLNSPAGRTKDRLPTLGVLIGWVAASEIGITNRFHMAFTEELWRRNFTTLYKGQPREPIIEVLEKLLYGPSGSSLDENDQDDDAIIRSNKANKERQFILWARYLRGDLPKKQADAVRKEYGAVGPEVEGLVSATDEYKPRKLLAYEEAPDFFNAVIDAELKKISRQNSFAADIYDGRPVGKGFSYCEQRLMLIQALQFTGNSVVNEAVAKGSYMDTFKCLTEGKSACICEQLHESFERHRHEKLSAVIEKRNALLTARRIVAADDLDAFAGRLAVSCPIRGGEVFNNVVALLTSSDAAKVSHLAEKITCVLTGKIGDCAVLAEGSSWIHCPVETARRLQEVVGEESFSAIELQMYGTWGHVYRPSDIPNRHGHCVSHPNEYLTQSFSGFRLVSACAAAKGA